MKLSLYKELLAVNPKLAMLIDLSERHPKGPEALLRGHHYQRRADTGYYDRHETELDGNALLADKKTRSQGAGRGPRAPGHVLAKGPKGQVPAQVP